MHARSYPKSCCCCCGRSVPPGVPLGSLSLVESVEGVSEEDAGDLTELELVHNAEAFEGILGGFELLGADVIPDFAITAVIIITATEINLRSDPRDALNSGHDISYLGTHFWALIQEHKNGS